MTELEKQFVFARLFARLVLYAFDQGYDANCGELWRSEETCELYAKAGKGIANSLHRRRLAGDLNLYKNKKYLTQSEDYKFLGDYWKSLSGLGYTCVWGGDFKDEKGRPKPDGNHFSIEHLGYK